MQRACAAQGNRPSMTAFSPYRHLGQLSCNIGERDER